ncbi:hypothetical protein D0Z08_04640 [Nocardioides immobilis]|uniref:DUF4367 domain-containing protein n=1 Tax=Nocardioides immobilis TaxID=2049295 RepID=A0A417Y6Y1_9ACTN|nr:hypothetical protein [Nocardioides immobilis]RHW28271.1 hypothetical protein D0Z08_04640 [Nocardioides immobilis]
MNDLIDRLARLDGTASTPSESVVSGDLARAHSALGRRRRTRAAMAGTGLTLGLGAALGVVTVIDNDADPRPATTPSDSGRQEAGSLDLVDYTGKQPEGFELAKVPAGYVLQGSDAYVLTLAASGDDTHPLDFENKVVIMLESQDAAQELGAGQDVTINGEPGVLETNGEGTRILRWFQGEHLVMVQVWEGIDLADDQVVELAEGITVSGDVEAGVG